MVKTVQSKWMKQPTILFVRTRHLPSGKVQHKPGAGKRDIARAGQYILYKRIQHGIVNVSTVAAD